VCFVGGVGEGLFADCRVPDCVLGLWTTVREGVRGVVEAAVRGCGAGDADREVRVFVG